MFLSLKVLLFFCVGVRHLAQFNQKRGYPSSWGAVCVVAGGVAYEWNATERWTQFKGMVKQSRIGKSGLK